MPVPDWPLGPPRPRLRPGMPQVWRIDLTPPNWAGLRGFLNPAEQARADRLRFEADRRRFTCARFALRALLAAYLDAAPRALEFRYGTHGKPGLGLPADSGLDFNLSHAGDYALLALHQGGRVGVDLEPARPLEAEKLAQRFFSPAEHAQMLGLPDETARLDYFYRVWTCKEAYLKATGEGLSGLDSIEVVCGAVPCLRPRRALADFDAWRLHLLYPAPTYAGALVAEHATAPPLTFAAPALPELAARYV